MKKKSLIWIIVIFLSLLVLALLLLKSFLIDTKSEKSVLVPEVKAEVFTPSSLPTISADEKVEGNINAPVKILVYEDYADTFSANLANTLESVKADFGDQVVIAFRPYVLKGNAASLEAAMAINCVADAKGDWLAMRQAVFQAVGSNNLSLEKISAKAEEQGLDKEKFSECLTSVEKQGIMLGVAEDAQRFSVYGAPTIFVNGELVVGARPYEDYTNDKGEAVEGLKNLIARHLK
jgi:protein-disulfide isomerase